MNKMIKFICLIAFCNTIIQNGFSQEIKRKVYLGIETVSVDDSNNPCVTAGNSIQGICIKSVVKGFTADALGLKKGDILLEINNFPVINKSDLQQRLTYAREGDVIEATVWRNGKKHRSKAIVIGRPYEPAINGEVIYDEVNFLGGKVRLIINKPVKAEKMPAILFIQGYPCSSIDNLNSNHPYKKLIETLVSKGMVVMRAEKLGMGDCLNTPNCYDVDMITETNAFTEAYKKLKTYSFVDTNQIFIFGHSLGGLSAPVVASQMHPKGVIVYGTTCEPWYEYLLKMLRYQNPLFGTDFLVAEEEMKLYQQLLYEHFILKKSPIERSQNSDYALLLKRDFQFDGKDGILGRVSTFWLSVNE